MRMIDVATVLRAGIVRSATRTCIRVIFAKGGGLSYNEPIANMMPAPIFWARGICNLTIVGMGMTKRRTSETMLATAMAMYNTAMLTQASVSATYFVSQAARSGRHPKRSSKARTVTYPVTIPMAANMAILNHLRDEI